ncbi:hypothetical protein L211DRAFT_846946 [Terfezia boudieri ATCC MYA-4762]|uniref:Uncharacterized protein n=1 Tax=Terfezia boudieri ATCC MYA-4762 TaxID=1051890 RepID=A0A3N4LV80_9PEZI|nr:hypothetical protein L211DRAFT_846946 [Terfezia boudieri ATCC MYA-4762]
MNSQPGYQPPRSGPETPTPPSTASSFAKQELLTEKKENAYLQHFSKTKTRVFAILNLGVHIMTTLTLTAIGWEAMSSGTVFTTEVFIAGIWGCIVCGLIVVIIAYPDAALTDFVIAPILFSMIGFVLDAMAFGHMGTHMSFMPEHDIRGYSPDLVFSCAVIFWASSTLLQSMLYTFLFTYGRMVRPPRPPQKDPEKGIVPRDPTPPKGGDEGHQEAKKPDSARRRGRAFHVGNQEPSERSCTIGHHRSPCHRLWKTASETDAPLSPRQRPVSLSDSSLYWAPKLQPYVANRPQSLPAIYPVSIIHGIPNFDNGENRFNPNMGPMRPISIACQSTTTVSDNMSERSVLMATGDNDVHRVSSIHAYDPCLTANLNSNRASVVTFVPAPGQLNMHPTRSYEMVVKDYVSNPDDMALKIIPQEFRRRHDMPPNDAECHFYYLMQPHHPAPAERIPPQFGEQQGQQRVPERRVVREIPGQHMALDNFKFGGKDTSPAAPTAHHQFLRLQHQQEAVEHNMDKEILGGNVAAPYAHVAGPSNPNALLEQTPTFGEGDDGMIPTFVYEVKPTGVATREEMLNFMC